MKPKSPVNHSQAVLLRLGRKWLPYFFLSAGLLLIQFNCTRREGAVLAVIGKRKITADDYVARFRSMQQKMNLPDNGQVRKETLRNMIDEEMLIAEAVRRGYEDDPVGQYENERLKIQTLLDAYLEKKILNRLSVQEEELQKMYMRLNTKIRARHLYAGSRKEADSVYAELMRGKSFEEMAKTVFNDPKLRDTGGDLGYFTVDEMDPAFEEAAFTTGIGKISQPIRTAQGYSILRVEDRIVQPMLIESEYAKHRAKLQDYCLYRQRKKTAQAYVDSLRNTLEISFNDPVVGEMFHLLRARNADPAIEKDHLLPDDDSVRNREIVRSKIGTWDVRTLNQYARFSSETQQRWIKNRENLEDFIAGLVVRAYLLSKAKESGLDHSASYPVQIRQKMDEYLLQRMEQTVSEATVIPDDSLRAYFKENGKEFILPAKIRLNQIQLIDESNVKTVERMLKKGTAFSEVARVYSQHEQDQEYDGDMGFFSRAELGPYADRIFPLEAGEWVGPISINSNYFFFQCTGKSEEHAQTFDEARPQIEKTLKPFWKKKTEQKFLEKIRKDIRVVAYHERLTSIQLN